MVIDVRRANESVSPAGIGGVAVERLDGGRERPVQAMLSLQAIDAGSQQNFVIVRDYPYNRFKS